MAGEPLKVNPDGERKCLCVLRHSPAPQELHRHHVWPLGKGGPDVAGNLRWLCPSSHAGAHKLWREYEKLRTTPPWATLRHYPRYVRELVADGWAQAQAITDPET